MSLVSGGTRRAVIGRAAGPGERAAPPALLQGLLVLPTAAGAATLTVEVAGVETDRGSARVAVCTPETFTTKHCPFSGSAPARAGGVAVGVEGVPAGRYTVQVYHDEDGDGRLRRGVFRVPTEAVGFSRDAPVRFVPPRLDDAAIDVAEPSTTTRLRLRHLGR